MAVEPEAPHLAAIEQLAHGEQPGAAAYPQRVSATAVR